jgi:LuxR family transcriptional activator of conjugal transfer of Ti plasmids
MRCDLKNTRINELIDSIKSAASKEEFLAAATGATQNLGFSWFGYLQDIRVPGSLISSYPGAWVSKYLNNNYVEIDPIVSKSRRSLSPFSWTYKELFHEFSSPQRRFVQDAARHGIQTGVTVPLPAGLDRISVWTFSGTEYANDCAHKMDELLATCQLVAFYFHAYFNDIPQRKLSANGAALLTPREKECLAWVSCGKTMADISEIIGITERTVSFHLSSARARLNSDTLAQAVAQAIRQGEI